MDLKLELSLFTGTEFWHRHPLNRELVLTDGAKFFMDRAEAWWFSDIVATELAPMQRKEPFMLIVLHSFDNKALLFADDGDGKKIWQRDIDYTDCPPGVWKFYLIDNVLLLPSEY